MANPYYTYSGAFIPGTLARAEQVGAEYSAVQAGFAILAIQGTDSGTANTYVVTTNGGPSGSYVDGNIVEFKAAASNTGASTINVNGIGVVGLTASGGGSLPAGAIVANTWYRAIYNSTYSAWTLIAPSSVTISTSTISAAAPTNKVGLAAAGGVSLAVVPIDATYALDQSIAPTWTGAHIFANTVAFSSTVTFATGLSLTGAAGAYALTLLGNSTLGQSRGLLIKAGTNASDIAVQVNKVDNSVTYFRVDGAGSVTVGNPTGGAKGIGTINATALYVQGAAVLTTAVASANPTATIGLSAVNGSAATFMTSDSAPALSQAIAPTWTAAHIFTPSSAVVAVTINAKADRNGLNIVGGTNTVNTFAMTIVSGLGSGFSSGLAVTAGTTSADSALLIRTAAAVNILNISGAGVSTFTNSSASASVLINGSTAEGLRIASTAASGSYLQIYNSATFVGFFGAAVQQLTSTTATDLGIACATGKNIYLGVNTVAVVKITGSAVQALGPVAAAFVDMTPDSGTFTFTITGCATAPTGTGRWVRSGNLVILLVPAIAATSNTTALTFTGMPAAIQPATTQGLAIPASFAEDSGAPSDLISCRVTAGSGTLTFLIQNSATSFTNVGGKGTLSPFTVSYLLT